MATVTIPNTFSGGSTILASEMNANFTALTDQINGSIDSDNLADGAVTAAKLAGGAVNRASVDATGAVAATMSAKQDCTASYAALAFDTEEYDYDSAYNNSTYTYTAPAAGLYTFKVIVTHFNASTIYTVELSLDKNSGTTIVESRSSSPANSSSFPRQTVLDATVALAAADTVVPKIKSNSTATDTSETYCRFEARMISAAS